MFNEEKTAQMAAYLLGKSGGRMRYIKLLKLLYLTDREAMRQTGDSMTHDRFFSMKNGPVLSRTLDLLAGKRRSAKWSELVGKSFYKAELARDIKIDDLDELSPLNMQIMDQIYEQFGNMHWGALCDWTHEHCGEWVNPGKSNNPITPGDIFKALGWSPDEAQKLEQQYGERRDLDRVMAHYE